MTTRHTPSHAVPAHHSSESTRFPRSLRRHLTRAAAVGLLATAGLAGLTGCHASEARQVSIAGYDAAAAASAATAWASQPLSVDIVNPAGSVIVRVDPTLEGPRVQARTRGKLPAADRVNATLAGSSLTARVQPQAGDADLVDVTVWVPESAGVRVQSSGGAVRLFDVAGPVAVDVGDATGHGGDIQLRTRRVLDEGVRLATTAGSVRAVMPARSLGQIQLRASNGKAYLRSDFGELVNAQVGPGFHTGTLNMGGPEVALLSGQGDVTLDLIDAPFESPAWPRR